MGGSYAIINHQCACMKHVGLTRIKSDKHDVQKVTDQLNRVGVFTHGRQNVVSLRARHVARLDITSALLTATSCGKAKLKEFVQTRLCTNSTGSHEKMLKIK